MHTLSAFDTQRSTLDAQRSALGEHTPFHPRTITPARSRCTQLRPCTALAPFCELQVAPGVSRGLQLHCNPRICGGLKFWDAPGGLRFQEFGVGFVPESVVLWWWWWWWWCVCPIWVPSMGVVPACRCCTVACTTSSARRGSGAATSRHSAQVQVQAQAVRNVHLPWSTRSPWLSLHSSGCSSRDSAAELPAPALTRLSTPPSPFLPIS